MRWRLNLLAAATSSAVVLAFLIPLPLLLPSLAEERTLATITADATNTAWVGVNARGSVVPLRGGLTDLDLLRQDRSVTVAGGLHPQPGPLRRRGGSWTIFITHVMARRRHGKKEATGMQVFHTGVQGPRIMALVPAGDRTTGQVAENFDLTETPGRLWFRRVELDDSHRPTA